MNTHKHARLTYARRLEMVRQMMFEGLSFTWAAAERGVTSATARKWLGRFLAGGESALADASSRPTCSPRAIDPGKALPIVELRRRDMLQALKGPNDLAYTAANRRHIGLSPLLPTPFNATRGPVKFYDFARMGAAGFYSEVVPFAGFVRDGVDGLLLPNEPARWIEALVALVNDAPRRSAIAAAARVRALSGA